MARTSKYFYPPRPGNGAGTFSDNIVGLQTVNAGGLTLGNFDFTSTITEKVNRKFNVGAFTEPMTLEDMEIDDLFESRRILASQFRVYPNYDVSQVANFSLYGSLAKRLSVSVTHIINYFPAALEVVFQNQAFSTGQPQLIFLMTQLKMKPSLRLIWIEYLIHLISIILKKQQQTSQLEKLPNLISEILLIPTYNIVLI